MESTAIRGGNMMDEKIKEKMVEELEALSREMYERREKIRKEWLKTHEMPLRGRMASKEQKALDKEEKRRYGEILAKYKDK